MKTGPAIRIICFIFAALLVLPTAALAETEFPFDPKKGGLEAEGPGKKKKAIRTGPKSARPRTNPASAGIGPYRIEFVAADPPRRVLTELRFDLPFIVRLVFERLPGRDRQEVELSQTRGGDSTVLYAKRVKRTKVFETGVVKLTKGKRSVTRAETKLPFDPRKGVLEARGPGRKKKRIRTVTGPVPEDFRRRVRRKTDEATSRITRKYERERAKYEKSLKDRWAKFLATQKRHKARMKRAADRCDRARYAQAKSDRDRAYRNLRADQKAEHNGYKALRAKTTAREERLDGQLERLRRRWNDLTVRAKLTSSGAKLVSAAVKPSIERYDSGQKIGLLAFKLESLDRHISDHMTFRFRGPAFPHPCSPPPRRTIAAVPSGTFKDSGSGASNNGKVTISCKQRTAGQALVCTGTYAGTGDGRPAKIEGKFISETTTLVGYWIERKSKRKCRRKRRNSYYWGRLRFVFHQDGRSWKGKWSYCGAAPNETWNGKK